LQFESRQKFNLVSSWQISQNHIFYGTAMALIASFPPEIAGRQKDGSKIACHGSDNRSKRIQLQGEESSDFS
jgi:hypothetical protein